jgi:hypothetical protein
MSSYDWFLFLHVLFAFALTAGIVCLVPYVTGGPDTPLVARLAKVGGILASVGGVGTLLLGLALTANRDYKFFTLWIVGAIVLWAVGMATGERVARVEDRRQAARLQWMSATAVFLILILMIFKPGA